MGVGSFDKMKRVKIELIGMLEYSLNDAQMVVC